MKMFDWDDHEIENILWGDGEEVEDHIVPYSEDIEKKDLPDYGDPDNKKLNEEDVNIQDAEKSASTSKLISDGGIQEKNGSIFASGTVMDLHLDLPSFGAKGTEVEIDPEISGIQQEDKELGEFVGSSWANIASFDDLDQIFSNDELDGHTSLGSADELWSPSKDPIRDAANLGPRSWEFGASGNTSSQIELNSEYMHKEYTTSTSALIEKKDDCPENQAKHQQITDKITNSALSGDVYDTWPSSVVNNSHYDRLCSPATVPNFPSAVQSQQRLPHDSRPIAYQHFTNTHVAPYTYRNFPRQYPSTHMLKSTNTENPSFMASSEVCQGDVVSFNKPIETTARPKKMTPQEKIQKLRRRQQMRAMLAIQKQQEQLSHQTASVEFPVTQKNCQAKQCLHMEKAELEADESLSNLPQGSPNKKDNLCDEYSAEDTVLYQLQDIIKGLDMKIRLCIKDSLYRLAHSATQRHYSSDMNAANRSNTPEPENAKEEISNRHRIAGNTNIEAETNHIDRAVAHLLFHQPFKLSPLSVKHAETPESSTSKRVCFDHDKAGNSLGSSFLASDEKFNLPSDGPKTQQPFVDSYVEDMLDISHTEISVNPQTEKTR